MRKQSNRTSRLAFCTRRTLTSAALLACVLFGARLAAQVASGSPAPVAAPATASQPPSADATIIVDKGQQAQVALAIPALKRRGTLSPAAERAARTLEDTLRMDLERSGVFVVQGPQQLAVLQLTGDQARDFELYRSLGNKVLLTGEIFEEGGRLVLEGRLFDLDSRQSILGKRYRGGFELARRMAHSFADEIVLYFTGRRGIALSSLAFYSDRSGFKEIYLMDSDGFDQRAITGHKSISMAPDWSPTGDAIAYVSYFNGAPGIYLVDLASGLKRPIVTDGTFNSSPSFSPDGKRIAYVHSMGGDTEIFVANRDGSGAKRLTFSPGIDANPAWSPTGAAIAFTSSRAGNPNVYVMDAEGTNLRRVSFEGNYNDGAAWSPDGKQLAYASRRRGNEFDVVVTDLAGLETRVLTGGPGSHETPTWSPDGRFIAFASTLSRRTQIKVVSAAGGRAELVTAEGNNWAPDWSSYPPQ